MNNYLYGMAELFAKEMIEHNLRCGATTLNTAFIADQACDLAYKIDQKVKSYAANQPTFLTEADVERLLHKHHKPVPKPLEPVPLEPPVESEVQ